MYSYLCRLVYRANYGGNMKITDIGPITYQGPKTKEMFAFRHYNEDEVILGKTMKEHLRFSVAYWHTMGFDGSDPFGNPNMIRDWNQGTPMEVAIQKVHAFFDILEKLGAPYFCFHDVDVAPQGESLQEFFENLDVITDLIKEKMDETGIKLLWNTANLFSDPYYSQGGATSCNAHAYARAAAQVKKSLDISKKLGGENFVFWGGREGYDSLLLSDVPFELDNLARFYRLALDYRNQIGHDAQFLIEPKPKEPTKHQYDFDVATSMAFLYKHNLQDHFKLNLEANHATLAGHTFEHEMVMARMFNALGSLDANQGDLLLGWDTDEFPTNLYDAIFTMQQLLENGGIAPGGINFDAKVRRTSFAPEDLLLSHIAGMDTYARGLKIAASLIEDNFFADIFKNRYESYQKDIGQEILKDEVSLESLSDFALNNPLNTNKSDHLEYIKARLNEYIR